MNYVIYIKHPDLYVSENKTLYHRHKGCISIILSGCFLISQAHLLEDDLKNKLLKIKNNLRIPQVLIFNKFSRTQRNVIFKILL